jgi:hypothetical protein
MSGKGSKGTKEEEALTRIAIVNSDKCKPRKCRTSTLRTADWNAGTMLRIL